MAAPGAKPFDWLGKDTNGNVASVVGSVLVLQGNARRRNATVVNDGVTIKYLCKADLALVNTGIPLYPNGGSYEINYTNPYYGPLSIFCTVAAENVAFTESE